MQLSAEPRNIFGKKLKKSREQGKLPAVLYGRKVENRPLFIGAKDFNKVWKEAGESTIIKLKPHATSDAAWPEVNVLIHEVALDPAKNEPVHIDFLAVEMDKPIAATVPLAFDGVAPAVKESAGVLVKVLHEVEVEALPKDLPNELKVNISGLANFGDKIHLKDIVLPLAVKIIGNPDEVVALVEAPREEEVPAEAPSIADIEVEKKGKKEEAAAEGGEKEK